MQDDTPDIDTREHDGLDIPFPFAYICQECQGQAFFFYRMPKYGEIIKARDIFYPDGTNPESGGIIECPLCRTHLPTLLSANVVKL